MIPDGENKKKIVAFDMDGTLLDGRVIQALAERFNFTSQLYKIQNDHSLAGYERSEKIAVLLKGLAEVDIIDTVSKMKMVDNWRQTIEEIKSCGYVTGIISDSYSLACEYLRKKMDLDFSISNTLQTDENHKLTGKISMPLGWEKIGCNCKISVCKRYQLEEICKKFGVPLSNTVVVGDTNSDLCMIKRAKIGIALMPKHKLIEECADVVIKIHDLSKIMPFVNN